MYKHFGTFLHQSGLPLALVFGLGCLGSLSLFAPLAMGAKTSLNDSLGPQSSGSVLDRFAEEPEANLGGIDSSGLAPSLGLGQRVVPLPAVLYQLPLGVPKSNGRSSEGPLTEFERIQRDHENVRQTLLKVAEDFGNDSQNVPYVWGGNKIGDSEACQACRSCIAKKTKLKVEKRSSVCKPCRQCGIDCSHFVHRVFQDAGLDFPYVTTGTLQRVSPLVLREEFKLVDMGRDLSKVRPGDLLLKRKHIVVVMRAGQDGRGDVLHVSRSTQKKGPGGGIEIAKNVDLRGFAGRLVKILRHVDTMNALDDLRGLKPLPEDIQGPKAPGDMEKDQVPTKRHPLQWSRTEMIVRLDQQVGPPLSRRFSHEMAF